MPANRGLARRGGQGIFRSRLERQTRGVLKVLLEKVNVTPKPIPNILRARQSPLWTLFSQGSGKHPLAWVADCVAIYAAIPTCKNSSQEYLF